MADERTRQTVKIVDPATDANEAAVDASGNLQVILAANTGVDVGDVDVLSLPTSPDTIADDAAFVVATSPVFPGGFLADETTPDSVDEGDVGAGRMSLNRNQYMQIRDGTAERSAAVDASNNLQVIAAANSGVDIGDVDVLSLPTSPDTIADDAAFTVATSPVFPMGALADETTPDSVDEGDIGAPRMSLNRNLYTAIRDAAGNERGVNVDASNNLQVILASNTGVDIGDVDVLTLPSDTFAAEAAALGLGVLIQGDDGTDRTNVLVDTAGHLQVDVLTGGGTDTPTSPINDYNTSAAVAAGSTANLDTADFGTATKKATLFQASASVPIKAEFGYVDNDVMTTLAVGFAPAGGQVVMQPRHRDYWSHAFTATAGLDGFRIIVTNLDTSQAADVYGTILYED